MQPSWNERKDPEVKVSRLMWIPGQALGLSQMERRFLIPPRNPRWGEQRWNDSAATSREARDAHRAGVAMIIALPQGVQIPVKKTCPLTVQGG
jgi:hypothetical protein